MKEIEKKIEDRKAAIAEASRTEYNQQAPGKMQFYNLLPSSCIMILSHSIS